MRSLEYSYLIMGRICSGKTTVARSLSKTLDIPIASFGAYLKNYAINHGIEPTRNSMQEIGDKMIKTDPRKFLEKVISFSIPSAGIIIFEGVRHRVILDEIENISERCLKVFIDVDELVRLDRWYKRDPQNVLMKYDDFLKIDNHIVEQEIPTLQVSADLNIDGTKPVDEILSIIIENN